MLCQNMEKACILVVDDRIDSREVIRAMLEANGHCTIGAGTAGEVISILDDRCGRGVTCPDLIILDIDLPDVRGGALGKWIRAVYPNIPFIFLTAYGRLPAFLETAKELGAPFEEKPIDPERFLPLITQTINDYQAKRIVGSGRLAIPEVMKEHIAQVAAERHKE